MGYDMYWRRLSTGEEAAALIAEDAHLRALKERDALPPEEKGTQSIDQFIRLEFDDPAAWTGRSDRYWKAQRQVMATSRANDEARGYFRLTGGGMADVCDLMERFGMAWHDTPLPPPYPKPEDHGVTSDEVAAWRHPEEYTGDQAHVLESARRNETLMVAYMAELTDLLRWHGNADRPGIPLHKFSSNDGWHVLAPECEAAVRLWRARSGELGEQETLRILGGHAETWGRWIVFLAGAARHDGFEVN